MTEAAGIVAREASGFRPKFGIVLGSGLGGFAARAKDPVVIPYAELPGFPRPSVSGHAGRLLLGEIGGTPTAILQGRVHAYESGNADGMAVPIRTLAALGCEALVLTNAAGSLRAERGPGSIVAISDHINLTGRSPLFGEAGAERFVDMTEAYDLALRAGLHAAAKAESVPLGEGVYMWFVGPQFETPAEIRAAKALGADLVGMSTVPETILARRAGLKVAALSIVTNMAAGLAPDAISHRQTLDVASRAAEALGRLLARFLADQAPKP
jgi:purine nucleotide phosphorylase